MAITQDVKDQVAKLLDNLNLGTKKAELGQQILALIDEAASGGISQGAAVTKLATPATATAEQVATTVNALIDSLKASGALA